MLKGALWTDRTAGGVGTKGKAVLMGTVKRETEAYYKC